MSNTTSLVAQKTSLNPFSSAEAFELSMRMAQVFYTSKMVPVTYQGAENCGNCMIALDMAARLGVSLLMVMQNLYIVHGTPSWSSKFLIGCFNECGRYTSINYETNVNSETDKSKWYCIAKATILATGEVIESDKITWEMVEAEGWSKKPGSKWLTMPGQMFRYRAAAFLIRTHAPELSFGFYTQEEAMDIDAEVVESRPMQAEPLAIENVSTAIEAVENCESLDELKAVWGQFRSLQKNEEFKSAKNAKKKELTAE